MTDNTLTCVRDPERHPMFWFVPGHVAPAVVEAAWRATVDAGELRRSVFAGSPVYMWARSIQSERGRPAYDLRATPAEGYAPVTVAWA